jgi:hypothetical protein
MSFPMARHERLGIEAAHQFVDRVCFVAFSLGRAGCGGLILKPLGHGRSRALTQNQRLLRPATSVKRQNFRCDEICTTRSP